MTRFCHIPSRALLIPGVLLLLAAPSVTKAAAKMVVVRRASPTTMRTFRWDVPRDIAASAPKENPRWPSLLDEGRWLLWSSLSRKTTTLSLASVPGLVGGKRGGWHGLNRRRSVDRLTTGLDKGQDLWKWWSHILGDFQFLPRLTGRGWLNLAPLLLAAGLPPNRLGEPDGAEDLECLADLIEAKVDFQVGPTSPGIRTPVTVETWVLGGVRYVNYYPDQHITQMDCRLVLALVRAGPILKSLGVRQVVWSSAYRPPDRMQVLGVKPYNKHTEGLAIDVHGFRFGGGIEADVARNYEKGLGFQRDASCLGRPDTQEGFLLRLVACRLDASDLFQEILTPDYDSDHWNHFHLAVFRPGETRRHKQTALLEVPLEKIPGWALTRWGHAKPNLELWKDVAKRPWPKGYDRIASRVRAGRDGVANSALLSIVRLGRYLTHAKPLAALQRSRSIVAR